MGHGLFASRMGHGLEWKGLKLLERHWKTLQLLRKLVNFSCRNNFLRADGEKAIFHVKTKLVLTFVCSLDFIYLLLLDESFPSYEYRYIQTLKATGLMWWIQHGLCYHSLVLGKWVNFQSILFKSISISTYISLLFFVCLGGGRSKTPTSSCEIFD